MPLLPPRHGRNQLSKNRRADPASLSASVARAPQGGCQSPIVPAVPLPSGAESGCLDDKIRAQVSENAASAAATSSSCQPGRSAKPAVANVSRSGGGGPGL